MLFLEVFKFPEQLENWMIHKEIFRHESLIYKNICVHFKLYDKNSLNIPLVDKLNIIMSSEN